MFRKIEVFLFNVVLIAESEIFSSLLGIFSLEKRLTMFVDVSALSH